VATAFSTNVGKATISLDVTGCVDCGTMGSSGWFPARYMTLRFGKKDFKLTIWRCADCQAKKGPVQEAML
jgi:hypothetical protein